MQPSVVQNSHIGTIDLDDASNYIALEEVFIGEKARKCLTDETHLVTSEVRSFQETCRNFWVAAAKYAVKKLPVESDFLKNLTWLFPRVRDYNNVGKVLLTASCLPQVIREKKTRLNFMKSSWIIVHPSFHQILHRLLHMK